VVGVVTGISAVTAMISVIEGARREIIAQVSLLGINNVVARPKSGGEGTLQPISYEDVAKLRTLVPFAEAWSPLAERTSRLEGPVGIADADILGVGPEFAGIMRLSPAAGRVIGVLDIDGDRRVAVLGAELARVLFGQRRAVGASLTIETDTYRVVGVLDRRESPAATGGTLSPRDLNRAVLVPARHDTFFGIPVGVSELWAKMPESVPVDRAGVVLSRALTSLHGGRQDFEVLVPLELLRQRLRAQRTFGVILASVSVLALLTGGLGIMNMMLASVLERTSEIGLRRAVGATRGWIVGQFLLESTTIAAAGGAIGIALGFLASMLISRYAGWPTHVSAWGLLVAATLSVVVGIVAGTYPSWRAAMLEPVAALHSE
jgi:putative ABC transport system permease protein